MRVIYEDGEYGAEQKAQSRGEEKKEFEDISSMSEEYKREQAAMTSRPRRPDPELLRDKKSNQTDDAAQPTQAPEQSPQPVQPTAYPYYQQYVPVQYVQGPTGQPVYYQPPQGYMPVYPQGYTPVPYAQPGYAPSVPPAAPEGEAGTRVLYQSPDFDNNERVMNKPVYSNAPLHSGSITQEDVVVLSGKAPSVKRAASGTAFQVDDIEMSVFELNSLSNKVSSRATTVRSPRKDGELDVEEYEQELEYEAAEDKEQTDASEEKSAKKPEKKKKVPVKEIVRKVILTVSLIAIVISVAMLLNEYKLSKENEKLEQEISDLIIEVDSYSDNKDESDDTQKKPDEAEKEPEKEPEELDPLQQWELIREEYPSVIFPASIQLKYAKLYGTNQDFVGYLSAEGVELSLPVVQAQDDEEYLTKNFYGKKTKYGCPFVTHLNNITETGLDTNTVIFGHHMNDGTVFGALDAYKSIEGFKAAPVISFDTLYRDYDWKVIAAFITNAYEEEDNGYVFRYYFTSLSSEERFAAYLNELSQRSLYDTGVNVLPTDKILTLSTCSHEFEDARFVVVARLVRNGESTEVDTSLATENPNPRYPQAYCDKNKITNHYKDAYRWEVG